MNSSPKIAKNTSYFTSALIIQKIISFIYFWFISNSLLPGQLGQYVFALSFTTLFSIFVDLGLSPVLTREAAKDQKKSNDYLKNVIALKIPLGILTILAAWLVINLTGKPVEVRTLVYLASLIMFMDSFSLSFWVMFRARHNLKYESIGAVLVQIIIFVLGIIALKTSGQVKYLILALVFASLFNLLYSFSLLKIKLKFLLRPAYNPEIVRHFLKVIPAFALAGIFVKIYNTVDSILLSYLATDAAVGYFAVPAKVVYAFQQIIPAAFAAVIFPAFSFYYATSKELLGKTFLKAIRYLTIISFPLAAGLIVLVKPIIAFFWPAYEIVIPTFMAMSLAIPFIFLAFPTGYLLNACDRQNNTTFNRGVITVLAVILNVALIPIYSYYGSGIAFLITNVVLLFLDFIWVRKIISIDFKELSLIILKTLVATGVMVIVILTLINQLQLLILGPIGAVVYFLVLYLVRGFKLSELKSINPINNVIPAKAGIQKDGVNRFPPARE